MIDLAAATREYQALLEGHRGLTFADDHDIREQVAEDLGKARAALEVAWLEHTTR